MGVEEAGRKYKRAMEDAGSRTNPRFSQLDHTLRRRGRTGANPGVHDKIRDGYEEGFGQFMEADVSGTPPSEAWHEEFETEEDRDKNTEKWKEKMKRVYGV